jgi:TRAP-type mannitol/chloroaromatic compound transport system permease small subunit
MFPAHGAVPTNRSLAAPHRRVGLLALVAVLLLVIVTNVVMRYAFGEGRVEFEEIQWHLYAAGFLLGLSYAAQADAHIRVDVVRDRLPLRWQAWIELYGTLLLLLPFIALILIYGVPFALTSYQLGEHSQAPGGLPWRWIIKSMLPLGFAAAGARRHVTPVAGVRLPVPGRGSCR